MFSSTIKKSVPGAMSDVAVRVVHHCAEGWCPPPHAAAAQAAANFGPRKFSAEKRATAMWTGLILGPAPHPAVLVDPRSPSSGIQHASHSSQGLFDVSRSPSARSSNTPATEEAKAPFPGTETSKTFTRSIVGPWVPIRKLVRIQKPCYDPSAFGHPVFSGMPGSPGPLASHFGQHPGISRRLKVTKAIIHAADIFKKSADKKEKGEGDSL